MKLFVGLGNPGGEYARHRHNVGFMALDRVAIRHGFPPWKSKFSGQSAEGMIDGQKVMLLKPSTYMNESGRAVGEAARFLKIDDADIIVFHDELDLAPGKLKVKTGGGNAGHNGLRSISAIRGNDYNRVRIGIGHPGAKELVHGWVLHDFAKADQTWLSPLLDQMADAAGRLAAGDLERFLTDVARGTRSEPEPKNAKNAKGAEGAADHVPLASTGVKSSPPTGERGNKRQNALAENLRKWMASRKT
jgi:peptidyl-tRNA hydrolase, PTH1 family